MRDTIDLRDGFYISNNILQYSKIKHAQRYLLCILFQLEVYGEKLDYTNKAFGVILKQTIRSVSRHLNELEEKGFITMIYDLKACEREIFLTDKARQLQKGGIK